MCLLLKLAAHNVREDLELAVCVRAEASLGLDAVLVDDAEAAIVVVLCVVVAECIRSAFTSLSSRTTHCSPGEAERMERLQPAMIGIAALGAGTRNELHRGYRGGRKSTEVVKSKSRPSGVAECSCGMDCRVQRRQLGRSVRYQVCGGCEDIRIITPPLYTLPAPRMKPRPHE